MAIGAQHHAPHGETEGHAPDPLWVALRDHLAALKARTMEQIQSYPPPIPACDLQFNHLIAERDTLSQELRSLEALRAETQDRDAARALAGFLRASQFIDQGTLRQIRARITC